MVRITSLLSTRCGMASHIGTIDTDHSAPLSARGTSRTRVMRTVCESFIGTRRDGHDPHRCTLSRGMVCGCSSQNRTPPYRARRSSVSSGALLSKPLQVTDLAGTILFGLSWWCPHVAFLFPLVAIYALSIRYTQPHDPESRRRFAKPD